MSAEEVVQSSAATLQSAERVCAASAQWIGIARRSDALDLDQKTLLHAGPPFGSAAEIPIPVRNAAAAAICYEGFARDPREAAAMIDAAVVTLESAQNHGVTTPLAAVVSASMMLNVVVDRVHGTRRFSPINEGAGPEAARFGTRHAGVVDRLRRVHREIGPSLGALLEEPIDLLPIARQSLAEGDENHGRVGVGSAALAALARARLGDRHSATLYFVEANQCFLNLWMAASAVMLGAGEGVASSSLVTSAGGNGHSFGIRIAHRPGYWHSAAAGPPIGPELSPTDAPVKRLPAIGDSAVIDALGLGALALEVAPDLVRLLGSDALCRSRMVADTLLLRAHPKLGRRVGLDAERVVSTGRLPVVCLAALDAAGRRGLVGRGLAEHPRLCYAAAVDAVRGLREPTP